MTQKPQIFVVGSLNIDFVLAVDRLPLAGETLRGGDLTLIPGGKGANQACSAGMLYGSTAMIGQVGQDPFALLLIESLERAGVDVSRIGHVDLPTGCASIYVTPNGQNSIVISPGANAALDPQTAIERLSGLSENDLVLLQLEIPFETVEAVAHHAHEAGARVILDPAPSRPLPRALLEHIDFLTPNQTEAADLLGGRPETFENPEDAETALNELLALDAQNVILKLGCNGCVFGNHEAHIHARAFDVQAIDTTAAGDVFNGAFATALAEDMPLEQALRFANAAAAISVTRRGAQSSIPKRIEVKNFLNQSF